MPRGRPKKPRPEAEETTVKPQDVKAVISAGKLKRLMAAKRSLTKDTAELRGQYGQQVANAIENDHLHRKAYNTICMLDRMENEKIADYWDHLQYMMDASGIMKRIESVMRMNLGENNDEAEDDDSNVTKFPKDDAA